VASTTHLLPPEGRDAVNTEHVKYTEAVEAAASELAALELLAALAEDHWKDVAREESIAALHRLFDERVAAGDIAGGAALDEAIVRAAEADQEFEDRNRLFGCPWQDRSGSRSGRTSRH
jgi:hypothetical protein